MPGLYVDLTENGTQVATVDLREEIPDGMYLDGELLIGDPDSDGFWDKVDEMTGVSKRHD